MAVDHSKYLLGLPPLRGLLDNDIKGDVMKEMFKTGEITNLIERVKVERETDKMIVIEGRRFARRSENTYNFFNTYEDAKLHLIKEAGKKVAAAERQLNYARKKQMKLLEKLAEMGDGENL